MGEVAARVAVGLDPEPGAGASGKNRKQRDGMIDDSTGNNELEEDDEDECILWSPTTADVCIHWKSDNEAWRKKRFERIQMEGTKDPRRGGSGTMR